MKKLLWRLVDVAESANRLEEPWKKEQDRPSDKYVPWFSMLPRIQIGLGKYLVRISVSVDGNLDSMQELVFANQAVDAAQSSLIEVLWVV